MKEVLIKAKQISKVYRLPGEEIKAINNIDLEIRQGEFTAIMGPSGSGKTTLLDILGCLDRISSGSLQVLGRDVSQAGENSLVRLRRKNIGFVFQDFLLIPTLSAKENVELSLLFSGLTQDQDKVINLLKRLGLGQRVNHLPKQLSGGEKQRVAIARALIIQPKLLFADEPTGNLDTKSGQQIFEILKELNQKDGLTIVLTTHNQKLGSQASQLIYLKDGRIVAKEESSFMPSEG